MENIQFSTGHNRPHTPITLSLCLVLFFCTAIANDEDNECVFDFNEAFSLNASGTDQLKLGQQYAEQGHFSRAKERYTMAIELISKSVKKYSALAESDLYCSPTNLTIAKENKKMAEENLQWAESALQGVDCIKELDVLESLTNEASTYFHDNRDTQAALETAELANNKAQSLKDSNVCTDDYLELLESQVEYTKKVQGSIKNRVRYEQCLTTLESAEKIEQGARKLEINYPNKPDKASWSELLTVSSAGIDNNLCDGLYLERLKNLRRTAEKYLNAATSATN